MTADIDERRAARAKAACLCESCKKKKGMLHRITSERIHNYTSMPESGWQPRRTIEEIEAGSKPPTFGIELETSVDEFQPRDLPGMPRIPDISINCTPAQLRVYDDARVAYRAWMRRNEEHRSQQWDEFQRTVLLPEEAVSLAEPPDMWWAKQDGSVTGPEFASQPATLAYWRGIEPQLERMFFTLLHGNVRSHDGDTAGMHVNIGSDAFGDAAHLYRFVKLLRDNKRWAVRMSQRTTESHAEWAHFDMWQNDGAIAEWATKWQSRGRVPGDHSSAVNASHEGRVEFRLPRGTLRLDRFMAKLEWTAAMVEYTGDPYNTLTSASFMAWVRNGAAYPALTAYLAEKFPALTEYIRQDEPIVMAAPVRGRYETCGYCGGARYRPSYGSQCDDFHEDGGYAETDSCPCGDGCPEGDCPACENGEDEDEADVGFSDDPDEVNTMCDSTYDSPNYGRIACLVGVHEDSTHPHEAVGYQWSTVESVEFIEAQRRLNELVLTLANRSAAESAESEIA